MSDEIELDHLGRLPADCPRTFYRVELWRGHRVSDWRTHSAADLRAREMSSDLWDEARVVTIHLSTGG